MRSIFVAAMCTVVVSACGPTPSVQISPTGKTLEASITNFVFSVPNNAMQGDLIQLKNNDSEAHNFMPLDDSFSIDVAAGQTVELPLLKKGTYQFHCHIHPNMMGTLVIN